MPSLVWSKAPSHVQSETDPRGRIRLLLMLDADERASLAAALAEIQANPSSELRHELSPRWTLFWKLRDAESRVLAAHPETDQWVATIALRAEDLVTLLDRIAAFSPGDGKFSVASLFPVASVSNLDFQLEPA